MRHILCKFEPNSRKNLFINLTTHTHPKHKNKQEFAIYTNFYDAPKAKTHFRLVFLVSFFFSLTMHINV